jgi:peptidoglycan hydrolase CwlO-like protein
MIIVFVVAIVVLVFFGLFTQVVLPLAQNRKMFPIFRTNELQTEVQELENETEDLEGKVTALEIIARLKERKKELESDIAKMEKLQDSLPPEEK